MDWISAQFTYYWDMCVNYYHVNPYIFITMYAVKSVIFWWTIALIVKRALRREWGRLTGLFLLNVSTNVSPWVYVWICGDNHPWWYEYMMYFVGGWGAVALAFDVRRRLRAKEGEGQPVSAE